MKKMLAIALSALSFAVFGGVGATQVWTSNYVQRVVDSLPAGTGISADEARRMLSGFVEQFFKDAIESGGIGGGGVGGIYADDMTTTNGVTTVYVVSSTNGVPVVVKREYDMRASIAYSPEYRGARVISSGLDAYPIGTIFAVTSDGHIESKAVRDDVSSFNFAEYGTSAEINMEGTPYSFDSQAIGKEIQIAKWAQQGGERVLVGTFTLEPLMLTETQFRAATDGENGDSRWSLLDPDVKSYIRLEWFRREIASARRILRAASPRGHIDIPLRYMGPDMVDYNVVHGDQLTDDDGDGEPDWEWVPRVGYDMYDWHNPAYWMVAYPINVTITDTDDEGNPITITRTIPNDAAFRALLGGYEVRIPPVDYNYPQRVPKNKFTCEKYGHVWGHGCVCTVCGTRREHDIPGVSEFAKECGRCKNKLTKKEAVGRDYKVIELDEECGEVDATADESKHAGWHHSGPIVDGDGMDDPIVFCTCECGAFGPENYILNHKLADEPDSVEKYDDSQHISTYTCKRGNCGHRMRKYDWHKVPPIDSEEAGASNIHYIDDFLHQADGECEVCHAIVSTTVGHLWGYYGGKKNKCKCPCQLEYEDADGDGIPLRAMHEWGSAERVNPYNGARVCRSIVCTRCGQYGKDNGLGHNITENDTPSAGHNGCNMTDGRPNTVNGETHWCDCAGFEEPHAFSRLGSDDDADEVCDGGGRLEPPFQNNELGGCGYSRKSRGADKREGNDSSETDPRGGGDSGSEGGDGQGGGKGNGENPPIPNPGDDDDDDPKPPSDDDDPPFPPDPPPPPFPPVPPTDFGMSGNSTTVDPNSVINNWQNVSAPYAPPPGPPPPWTL